MLLLPDMYVLTLTSDDPTVTEQLLQNKMKESVRICIDFKIISCIALMFHDRRSMLELKQR